MGQKALKNLTGKLFSVYNADKPVKGLITESVLRSISYSWIEKEYRNNSSIL